MVFPIDLHSGSVVIPSHLIFDIVAFYAAVRYYLYLSTRNADVLSENSRLILTSAGAFGALIGCYLLAALERPHLFLHPSSIFFYVQDQTIAGGLIGAIIGVEIAKRIIGEKKRSGDLFTYPLILGIMIGRVGCFLTGIKDDTVGLPSHLPWAIDQGDGIRRHPTSLYEILFLGLLWIALYQIQKRVKIRSGTLFRLFIIGYCTFRFFVEFIKPVQHIAFGLSSIQIACFCVALIYILSFIIPVMRKIRGRPSDTVEVL